MLRSVFGKNAISFVAALLTLGAVFGMQAGEASAQTGTTIGDTARHMLVPELQGARNPVTHSALRFMAGTVLKTTTDPKLRLGIEAALKAYTQSASAFIAIDDSRMPQQTIDGMIASISGDGIRLLDVLQTDKAAFDAARAAVINRDFKGSKRTFAAHMDNLALWGAPAPIAKHKRTACTAGITC